MITLPIWLFALIIFMAFAFVIVFMSLFAGSKYIEYAAIIKKLEENLKYIKHKYNKLNNQYSHLIRVNDMTNTIKENSSEQIKKQSKN